MKIILTSDVEKIGKSGQVVQVKDGYARNCLFPKNLAVEVTAANVKKLEQEKARREQSQEKKKQEALALQERLSSVSLTIPALIQTEDHVYGSIGAQEISNALKEEGYQIEKQAILLPELLKALGIYEVPVKLHPEVTATIKVWIVKK
ncbi:MAG: 50S ribosomal protein L9 [Candidatus Omnitrophica bacterium]|nr:50S ribosomal protein L9 [Candidatus Omnitrophota bacterium]